MSELTPVWILLVALAGSGALGLLHHAIDPRAAGPGEMVLAVRRAFAEPISVPEQRDGVLFHLAPLLLVLGAVGALAFVPWSPSFRGIDLSTGAIAFPAMLAYVTPAIFMAGWGSGRPLAVVGAFRWIALMLAYAMPLAMTLTAVAAPAGSLRVTDIVDVQHAVPAALVQPLAFALWLPAVQAVCFLSPFDVAQASGELRGGVFDEYRGLDRALVDLAQRILILAVSGMTAALFLAGWHGPLLPGALWMAIKTAAVAALLLWSATRLPRMPVDQVVSLAWRLANPLAIVAIAWGGLVTLVFYR